MNRIKKISIYIIIMLVLLIGVSYFTRDKFRNKDHITANVINRIWNMNTFKFDVKNDKNQRLKIFWKSQLPPKQVLIYESGTNVAPNIDNVYGPNKFIIEVDNSVKKEINFVKTNWWYTYDFHFKIDLEKEEFLLEGIGS